MSELLEALNKASQTDLDEIDKRLKELDDERAGLQAARRLLAAKLGGAVKRAASATGKKGREGMTTKATKIYDLISREGSLPIDVIASRLQLPPKSIERTVTLSDWLKRAPSGDVEIAMS